MVRIGGWGNSDKISIMFQDGISQAYPDRYYRFKAVAGVEQVELIKQTLVSRVFAGEPYQVRSRDSFIGQQQIGDSVFHRNYPKDIGGNMSPRETDATASELFFESRNKIGLAGIIQPEKVILQPSAAPMLKIKGFLKLIFVDDSVL